MRCSCETTKFSCSAAETTFPAQIAILFRRKQQKKEDKANVNKLGISQTELEMGGAAYLGRSSPAWHRS